MVRVLMKAKFFNDLLATVRNFQKVVMLNKKDLGWKI